MAEQELTPQEQYEAALASLNAKQRRFVEEYLVCLNASEAARRAKYATKPNVQGARMLANASIQRAVAAGMALHTMPAPEVLYRLTSIARGTGYDFVTVYESPLTDLSGEPVLGKDGAPIVRRFPSLDLEKAEQHGMLHLVKKIGYTAFGPSVELYDAQAALALIGKHHGLFVEKIDISRQEIEAFLDRLKHNLSPDEYARIVALAAGQGADRE